MTAYVCMLQIILILNRTKATDYKETIDKPFCDMLVFFACFCMIDGLWGICYSKAIVNESFFMLVSYGYHSGAALSAFIGVGYGIYYTKAEGIEKKILNLLRYVLLTIQMLAILSNCLTRNAFSVDAYGNYSMGSLRVFLYALQYTYYIILMGYAMLKLLKKSQNARKYKTALLFSFFTLIFGVGQYVFYDVAMYSLGFLLAAFVIYSFNVNAQREYFMEERFYSLDRKQSAIIHGLAGDFVDIYYVNTDTGAFEIYRRPEDGKGIVKEEKNNGNYFESVISFGEKIVLPEDLVIFREKFTKKAILEALAITPEYDIVIRVIYENQPRYFKYRFVRPIEKGEENRLIVGVYNVDEEVQKERLREAEKKEAEERERALTAQANKLSVDAYMDALTEIHNRRAYEEDLKIYEKERLQKNLIYFSIDVNGLKVVNDNLGHEAGDEIIRGAADCMKRALDKYGKIYRVGGDEFAAIIPLPESRGAKLQSILEDMVTNWRGELVQELSISCGVVCTAEFPDVNMDEIAKIADKKMFLRKTRYYAEKGIDRCGQQEAYGAICDSYTKILKINLTEDTHKIIQMNEVEKEESSGYNKKISLWLQDFGESNLVHPEDSQEFLEKVQMENLREFFRKGNKRLALYYRRRDGDYYKQNLMEMVPAKEYTNENQVVFIFVKNIEH